MITNGQGDQVAAPAIRWQGQRVDAEAPGALPGLARVSGLIRSIQTPEFRGVTFHEVLAKSALNHVPPTSTSLPGEWTINPYRGCTHACVYCYARPTHEHLGLGVGADFERQIVVKTNVADILRSELARKRSLPDRVSLGTNTDPYQRAEGRYSLMPGIIDALADARLPFSILTKGTLIRRDLERLVRASRVAPVHIGMSIAVFDDEAQRLLEPGTPSAAARIETVRAIRAAGLDCTVFVAPIMPGITDSGPQLDELIGALAGAGATDILPTVLYLLPGVKPLYFDWLRAYRPDLVADYTRLYAEGSRAPKSYRDVVHARVRAALRHHGLPIPDDETADKFALHGKRVAAAPAEPTLF